MSKPKLQILEDCSCPPKYGTNSIYAQYLRDLKPTQCLLVQAENPLKSCYRSAKALGIKITSRKLPQGGWGIWVIPPRSSP